MTSQHPSELPGYNLPLNYEPTCKDPLPRNSLFPNALCYRNIDDGEANFPLLPLRELTMLRIMDSITDKPNWETKVFDDRIAGKWKAEILAQSNSTSDGRHNATQEPGAGENGENSRLDVTVAMMDWVIDELRYKAQDFKRTGAVSVYEGDVVKSDTAVSHLLKEALKAGVASLENVPDDQKDYHPGSNDQVLDLVHPSLFPLVYGRSRIMPGALMGISDGIANCGKGDVLPVPPASETRLPVGIRWGGNGYVADGIPMARPYSTKFQWLPCDVAFVAGSNSQDPTDRGCKITSYINNLHPDKHGDLYDVVASIIDKAIPLWNKTLTPLADELYPRFERIKYTSCVYDPDPDEMPDEVKPQQGPDEDEDDYLDRLSRWEEDTRRVVLPEPGKFDPLGEIYRDNIKHEEYFEEDGFTPKSGKMVDLKRDYAEKGLQVIVKLANIHLTPEKPEYGGGTWHVEGQMNEHICATALYYYDSDNITESRLGFRQHCSFDDLGVSYEQEHHDWLTDVYGCEQEGPMIQEIGSVNCREGRLLTFPNILQHRVQPFRLQDPTKPGHRKILALFLVDPNIRIISTANVPSQRRDWWEEKIPWQSITGHLPAELSHEIMSYVDESGFPISMDDAKRLRLELMEERKMVVKEQDEAFEYETFSLCEH